MRGSSAWVPLRHIGASLEYFSPEPISRCLLKFFAATGDPTP